MRLVTRSDFDGLVCAMLLKRLSIIDNILFVHPKDVQDGMIELCGTDITTNIPYNPNVFMCFDNHISEVSRNSTRADSGRWIIDTNAKSTSRVVYDFYKDYSKLDDIDLSILDAVDKCDSGDFTLDDILYPEGWVLMNFLMDARTGLGRFHNFSISNYDLMLKLIDICGSLTLNELLQLPDIQERISLYMDHQTLFRKQIERKIKIKGKCGIVDLREESIIYCGNRFMIYAMYPQIEYSVHIKWGIRRQNTVIAVGRNVLNRRGKCNVGELMLEYGGGGHNNAGTCQVLNANGDRVLKEVVRRINKC